MPFKFSLSGYKLRIQTYLLSFFHDHIPKASSKIKFSLVFGTNIFDGYKIVLLSICAHWESKIPSMNALKIASTLKPSPGTIIFLLPVLPLLFVPTFIIMLANLIFNHRSFQFLYQAVWDLFFPSTNSVLCISRSSVENFCDSDTKQILIEMPNK